MDTAEARTSRRAPASPFGPGARRRDPSPAARPRVARRLRSVATAAAVPLLMLAPLACGGGEEGGEAGAETSAAGEGTGGSDAVVHVYSHRHYPSDQELYDRFTEETGIEVRVVSGSADQLITRLETEGEGSRADVLVTVDAGRLQRAVERDLLQPVSSETLEERVPAHLRHPEGLWFGLTERARIVTYARDRVDPSELPDYEALAGDRWDDRVLVRSSENVYNQSLLASLVAANGEDAARSWARGVVGNMARPPQGGDTDQAKGVAAGVGDVALVNHYYVARLKTSDDPQERRVGDALGVHFPNQDGRGTHVNVSGAGVTASADHPDAAVRLLEFLAGPEAQRVFARANHEYPVHADVEPSELLRSWGDFRSDTINLSELGRLNDRAVRIFDEVGWR